MVAITVILAAVIAAFVFGMSGQITKSKIVSVSATQATADKITVMYQGGQDNRMLKYATINVTDDDGEYIANIGNLSNVVGDIVVVEKVGKLSNDNHVIVVGYFIDNTQQVLLDTYI